MMKDEALYESVEDVIVSDMKDAIDQELLSGRNFDDELDILLGIDDSTKIEGTEED